MFQLHCKLGDCQILSSNFVVIKRSKYQVQWRKPSQLLGGLLNQDINVINSIIFEDDKKKKNIADNCIRSFQDNSWCRRIYIRRWDLNNVHLDVGTNNGNLELVIEVNFWKKHEYELHAKLSHRKTVEVIVYLCLLNRILCKN